jgi:hypothetical protein
MYLRNFIFYLLEPKTLAGFELLDPAPNVRNPGACGMLLCLLISGALWVGGIERCFGFSSRVGNPAVRGG